MKLLFALSFVAACLIFPPTVFANDLSHAENPLVRVRLKSQQDEIVISGQQLKVQGVTHALQTVALPQNETLRIRRFQKDGHAYWLISRTPSARANVISDEYLRIDGENLHANAQALPKSILLSPAGAKKMDVVGILPLEDYLVGVLASEMPLTWPLETLKAQAIASRSYTLAVLHERRNKVYHLESSILDQVFRQVVRGDETALTKKAAQAVRETRSQTLLTPKGNVLKAFYHSDCGGRTVSAVSVWKSGVNSGEAVDDSCPTNPKAQWQLSVSKEDLYAKIKKFLSLEKNPADISGLNFLPVPGTDRIQSVQVAFNDGESRQMNANDFRGLVGFQDLRSTLFTTKEDAKVIAFSGRGFGHGVGLCQWGSRILGQQGKNYQEILKHYYPLAKLEATIRN